MSTSRGRQNTTRFNPFLALLLIVLAAVGTLITLEATGNTNLGLATLFGRETKAATSGVPVLFSVRALQPGDQISKAAVWDPQLRGIRRGLVPQEAWDEYHYATGYNQIKDRVMAVAKSPEEPFVLSDFLPKESQPGVVGLVPEGMELVMLDTQKVLGIDALGYRNRFDLKASRQVNEEIGRAAEDALEARTHVSSKDRIKLAAIPKAPERLLLAQNGMVIRRSSKLGKKTVVAVALDPDDVDLVLDALAGDETIYCVAHSGAAEPDVPRIVPETVDPMAPYKWLLDETREIEVYIGNERSVGLVPVNDGASD